MVAGAEANFSVTAAGTGPFTYQWMKNGLNIVGATNSTYSVAAASTADVGTYSVKVTGPVGTVTSLGATLSVLNPIVFSTQPSSADINILSGTTKALSVVVSGSGPFAYQWRKNGVNITGATLVSYTVVAGAEAGSAVYDVVVSNPVGSSVSNPVKVSTFVAASIAFQPANVGIVLGRQALFTVTPSGTGPFTYQWMKNGVVIASATNSTLTLSSVSTSDVGSYTVKVTNSVSTVVSAAATLSIVTPPSVVTQPAGISKIQGQSAAFVATVSGTAPLTYQWLKDGVLIPGAVSLTYSIASVQSSDAGAYKLLVMNSGGSVYSQEVSLVVMTVPVILTQPTSYAGELPASKGNYPVSVFDFNTGSQGWVFGATTADRSTDAWFHGWDDPANPVDGLIECDNFTGLNGDRFAKSPWISLIGVTTPTVSFRANTYGGPGTLAIETSLDGLTWSALKSPVPQASGGSDTYTCSLGAYAGVGCYIRARLSGVNIAGVIDDFNISGYKYPTGASVQFMATATGGSLSYQWYKDGVAIAGATSATYMVSDVNQSGATGSYTVKVTNAAGSATSTAATLALLAPPVFTSQPASISRYVGQSASFSVAVSSAAPVSYQWYKDGAAISGAIGSSYSIGSLGINDGGIYKVRVSNAASAYFSSGATLSLAPYIQSQPASYFGAMEFRVDTQLENYNPDLGATPESWTMTKSGTSSGWVSSVNSSGYMYVQKMSGDFVSGSYQSVGYRQKIFIYDTRNKSYTTVDLPDLDGDYVEITGMDGKRVVGYYYYIPDKTYRYFYYDGVSCQRFSLPGFGYCAVTGLDGDRFFSGGSVYQAGVWTPFVIPGSTMVHIKGMSGAVVFGSFVDAVGEFGFYYDGTTLTTSKNGGKLAGINVAGVNIGAINCVSGKWIAGTYALSSEPMSYFGFRDFIYDGTNFTSFNPIYPFKGNVKGVIRGISGSGVVTGTYTDDYPKKGSSEVGFLFDGVSTEFFRPPVNSANAWGAFCENDSNPASDYSVVSPRIDLRNVSGAYMQFYADLSRATLPADFMIEGSEDGNTWRSITAIARNSTAYDNFYSADLSGHDGQMCFVRVRLKGANSKARIWNIYVRGMAYLVDPETRFAVSVAGAGCSYQWYKDDTPISGANSAEYSVPDRYAAGVQGSYVVKVTNSVGTVTSNPAVLKLYATPAVTSQPVSQSIKGPTFSLVTTRFFDFSTGADGWTYGSYVGNASPYHWDWNGSSGVLSDRLLGATYASYTDTFTQSPYLSLAGVGSSSLTFSASHQLYADGMDALQVQASVDGVNWSTLRTITGSGNTYYTVNLSAYDYLGCYLRFRLLTSSAYNSTGVNIDNVSITGLVVSVPGSAVTFSVAVADASACTYQWYKNGVAIEGAMGSAYTIGSVISTDAGSYNVKVTNPAGSTYSNYASLTVRN